MKKVHLFMLLSSVIGNLVCIPNDYYKLQSLREEFWRQNRNLVDATTKYFLGTSPEWAERRRKAELLPKKIEIIEEQIKELEADPEIAGYEWKKDFKKYQEAIKDLTSAEEKLQEDIQAIKNSDHYKDNALRQYHAMPMGIAGPIVPVSADYYSHAAIAKEEEQKKERLLQEKNKELENAKKNFSRLIDKTNNMPINIANKLKLEKLFEDSQSSINELD